ncbi:MAG: pantoate--beta-alanine ligase [Lewinellaceae bacterium]|nr:pantoate--beta-alanine ligase [Lewinellaceae bacterium]
MFVFKTVDSLQVHLARCRARGQRIGFVPTMGALHAGHLQLLDLSRQNNACTVCSIFVNPTQFNDAADLERYPRTPGRDLDLLEQTGVDVVFMPGVADVYPPGQQDELLPDFGSLDKVLEGEFRPGHFTGVAQVVKRLLDIVAPHQLIMGQKDYQQVAIIRHLIQQLGLPVELVMAPTVREEDGLAMSSRNVRLDPEMRQRAPVIYQTLRDFKEMLATFPPEAVEGFAMDQLSASGLRPEYFEIVDGDTLEPVTHPGSTARIVACTAVWAGDVRLIDNLIWKDDTLG